MIFFLLKQIIFVCSKEILHLKSNRVSVSLPRSFYPGHNRHTPYFSSATQNLMHTCFLFVDFMWSFNIYFTIFYNNLTFYLICIFQFINSDLPKMKNYLLLFVIKSKQLIMYLFYLFFLLILSFTRSLTQAYISSITIKRYFLWIIYQTEINLSEEISNRN